jgi:hypothetical protein
VPPGTHVSAPSFETVVGPPAWFNYITNNFKKSTIFDEPTMSGFEGPYPGVSCDTSSTLDSSTPWLQDTFFVNMIAPDTLRPFAMAAGNSHPSLLHLANLVLRAVLEVVCVSLPGYILASQGMFDVDHQKFAANLNIMLFTPCLSTFDFLWRLCLLTSFSLLQNRISTITRKVP